MISVKRFAHSFRNRLSTQIVRQHRRPSEGLQGSPLKSRHDDESDDRKKFCTATKHGCTLEATVVDWQAQTVTMEALVALIFYLGSQEA